MMVADASALVEMLLGTEAGRRIEERLLGSGEPFHAPHLVDLEVASAMRKLVLRREVSPDAGLCALRDLADLPLLRVPHEPFLPRLWALRARFTPYDAAYVALAEALPAVLVTRDAKLAKAARRLVTVELL
ncbi:MAG: type II toxin-antitoxin system VapC family toxin [Planctomycetes bacterium]|jgi:predicted nucleic acid-binding protein|nr:type II toxin-antitoxin system VapC family toxin [Planctomycetota bacterium]